MKKIIAVVLLVCGVFAVTYAPEYNKNVNYDIIDSYVRDTYAGTVEHVKRFSTEDSDSIKYTRVLQQTVAPYSVFKVSAVDGAIVEDTYSTVKTVETAYDEMSDLLRSNFQSYALAFDSPFVSDERVTTRINIMLNGYEVVQLGTAFCADSLRDCIPESVDASAVFVWLGDGNVVELTQDMSLLGCTSVSDWRMALPSTEYPVCTLNMDENTGTASLNGLDLSKFIYS